MVQNSSDFCLRLWTWTLSNQRNTVKPWSTGDKKMAGAGRGRAFIWPRVCKLLNREAVSWRTEDQPGRIGGQWTSDSVLAVMRSIISLLLRLILQAQGFCYSASTPSALLKMCAKSKHDKEFVSRRLIFWNGLRNRSTLLSLESEAG